MPKKIVIELNEDEASLFLWFRKYQHLWEIARRLKPGRLVIHFDSSNEIKHKEIHDYTPENIKKSSLIKCG